MVDHTKFPVQWHGAPVQYPEILSSPIAYVASTYTFQDVFEFHEATGIDPYWRLYGYWCFQSYYELFQNTIMEDYRNHPRVNSYLLYSKGPDRILGYFNFYGPYGKGTDGKAVPAVYDPTNGTISSGDICVWGP
ncbi:MAG TPA: hypothetical protein PLS90_10060 [Candidatus Sumerlaeota bacterium]|nr:hypothetical protein [Candidatus Sumerlaeota bacterium]